MRTYTVAQQKQLLPDAQIRSGFVQRPDIAALPPAQQEAAWQAELRTIDALRARLATCEVVVIKR